MRRISAAEGGLTCKETSSLPKKAANYYAMTKLVAEKIIDKAFQEIELPVITVRPRGIFGPNDSAIMPRIARFAKKGKMPLINGGKALIDMTYVDNVVDSLLLCSRASSEFLGKKYNVTNGEPMSVRFFLERICSEMDWKVEFRETPFFIAYGMAACLEFFSRITLRQKEPSLTRYGVGVLAMNQTLDIESARSELAYMPRVSIEEGIKRCAQWWRDNGT